MSEKASIRVQDTILLISVSSKVLSLLMPMLLVFKGPVAWTGKRPETGPNQTAVAVALPFWMDEPLATALRYPFKIPSKRT